MTETTTLPPMRAKIEEVIAQAAAIDAAWAEVLEEAGDRVILDCFVPRRRGPLPRGCTREDVEQAFPGWQITEVIDADTDPDPIARVFKFDEVFYRLRRR